MWLVGKWHNSPSSMPSSLIQITLKCIVWGLIFVPTHHQPIKSKRSPLEIGLVSFTNAAKYHPPSVSSNKTVTISKSAKVEIPFHPHVVIPSSTHSRHVWVPGHVDHHAFIPAHAHHVYVPDHALRLTRTVHAVLVPREYHNGNELFRSHVGGFGVGVGYGGQGAGHGFHVSF